jgi:hypothetical protein
MRGRGCVPLLLDLCDAMKRLAFILTFGVSVLFDCGDLLESAVMVAIVYGIFELLNRLLKAWLKKKRREAKAAEAE